MKTKKNTASEREVLLRDIFFDGGQWTIEYMNTLLLRKHFTNWFAYPLKCNVDEWIFVESLIESEKINFSKNPFYTMLWAVAYYAKEFDEVFPLEWQDTKEEIENEKREIKIKKLQNEIKKAFGEKKRKVEYDEIVIKGNKGDERKTNYTISNSKFEISEISFTVNSVPISIDDEKLLRDFKKLFVSKVMDYEPKITGLKIPTKNQAIHTLAIQKLYPFYLLLLEEGFVKNPNRAYIVIEKLLVYYGFNKVVGNLDSISQIKNTLKNFKKTGFI